MSNKKTQTILLTGIMISMFFILPVKATTYDMYGRFWKVTSEDWISETFGNAEPYMQMGVSGSISRDDYSSTGSISKNDQYDFDENWYHRTIEVEDGDLIWLNFYEDDWLLPDDYIGDDESTIVGTGTYTLMAGYNGFFAYARFYVT